VAQARGDAGLSEPIFFASPDEFYAWLEEHHATASEVYVGYYKKATGKPSLSWSEAVDQALCFGWIDGRLNRIDGERHMQRFTPRRPRSTWSNINIAKVERLKQAGLMRTAGLRAFEACSDARSGVYSFEQRREARLPADYEERLRANAAAWEYWQARPPSYRRTASFWVVSAKREETRERRLAQLIESCAAGRHAPPFIPRPGARQGTT
jgi:uncharacterized protein YdeI (YjbR/CyaY-like superfamily)